MKKQIAGIVLSLSVAGGVGTGVLADTLTSDEPSTTAGPTTTPSSTPSVTDSASTPTPTAPQTTPTGTATQTPPPELPAPADFVLAPGSVGKVLAGMSKKDALATGLFNANIPAPAEGCPAPPLEWKKEYTGIFDVMTLGNGEIASLGVWAKGPQTKDGLGVGSTYGQLLDAIPDATPVEAGYGQAGVFEYNYTDGGWIGYLFDTTVDSIASGDKVTFIEITKRAQPGLMRDGC